MALFEGKTPAERNKMIAAVVLPLIALIFVVRMLFFGGPSSPTTATNTNSRRASSQRAQTANSNARNANAPADGVEEAAANIMPIDCCAPPFYGEGSGRNIFAFYEKPLAPVKNTNEAIPTPATPTPTPPITLASLSPQSVFARTGNFTLQLSGDKFGPADRVYIDNQDVPTQYRSIQQLTATVSSSLITGPGQRKVVVRTPDGKLYSNEQMLNVMQPPAPTYTYVGFLKRARSNAAIMKDSRGTDLYTVREGDIIEGRFRVVEISERGVEVVDKDLNIKHTMPYVASGAGNPLQGRAPGSIQPPPPPSDEGGDEEPQ